MINSFSALSESKKTIINDHLGTEKSLKPKYIIINWHLYPLYCILYVVSPYNFKSILQSGLVLLTAANIIYKAN